MDNGTETGIKNHPFPVPRVSKHLPLSQQDSTAASSHREEREQLSKRLQSQHETEGRHCFAVDGHARGSIANK